MSILISFVNILKIIVCFKRWTKHVVGATKLASLKNTLQMLAK
jgi:hypothetical protein